jgi:hypothetical protein
LLQIAAEWRAVLMHSLEHNRVAPDDLQIVYDLIRGEENIIDDIVHFLGGKVTVALFEHTELPEWCAGLRRTLTLVAHRQSRHSLRAAPGAITAAKS